MRTAITERMAEDAEFGTDIMRACGIPQYVEDIPGIEMSVGGWFNGKKFCKPALIYFPQRKLMFGDIGPVTDGMGIVSAYRNHSSLFQRTIVKAESFLRTTGHHGYIGLDCVIKDDVAYGLRWLTMLDPILTGVHKDMPKTGSWDTFLKQILLGKEPKVPIDTSQWNVSVCLYTGPVPFVFNSVITASDVNLRVARDKVYKLLNKQPLSENIIYRTDIGRSVIAAIPNLKAWRWVR